MPCKKGPSKGALLLGLLAGLMIMAGGAGQAQADEWRIATLAPDGSAWMKILSKGAADIEAKTSSRVKLKYYTGGVQGDEKDVIRKMKMGGLDGGAFTSVGLSQIVPSIRVLELPMLFESVQEMDYVRKKMWGTFMKRFKKKNYMLLDPGDVGPIHFYSNRPIKTQADLKKAKVWLWGEDALVKAMFKKVGVNGVPMGVPDVLPALNTGRINACYGSPLAVVALQWYTKIKFMTSMTTSYGVSSTVIRKDIWDKMSAGDLKLVKKSLRKHSSKLRKVVRKDNKRAHKAMIRAGVKEIETPASTKAAFKTTGEEVWKLMVGKLYSQKDLDRVLKYRAEYRAK
jgi:TRAP-type C4-dicarboxylate transport system substrate-binding protein